MNMPSPIYVTLTLKGRKHSTEQLWSQNQVIIRKMTFTSFVGIVNSENKRGNITETTERKKKRT